jgi:outer membrane receptor protein involved in Fe transport
MLNKSHFLSTSAAALALSLVPHAASAQTAAGASDTETSEADSRDIGEIIVTAQKRGENINSVGLAITAVTGEQLTQKGVTVVSDLVKLEPSLQFSQTQNGTPVYSLRGIGYFEQSLSATPTVSLYQDEVPFAFPVMSKGVLLDLERVEILKGPQGTLYGQNATGGAVNFIAAKPTTELRTGADLGFGRFNEYHMSAFISGPLSSTLTARLAASHDGGGAWQQSRTRNDKLGDKDTQAVRLLVDWEPSSNFKASLNLNGWWDKSDTQAGQLVGFRFQSPANFGNNPTLAASYIPAASGTAAFAAYPALIQSVLSAPINPTNARQADWQAGTRPQNDMRNLQASLRLDYELSDSIGITSITNYADFKENNFVDVTGNRVFNHTALVTGAVKSFSQELRLRGDLGDQGHWLIGANYASDKSNEVDTVNEQGSVSYTTAAFGLAPFFGFGAINSDTAKTYSVFANADYKITDTLQLNAGIRYTKSEQSLDGCSTSQFDSVNFLQGFVSSLFGNPFVIPARGSCVTLGPTGLLGNTHNDLKESNVPWRVGINWTPIERTLFYATVSKGFKAGSSPALGASNSNQLTPVTQEALLAYELGVKSSLFNRTLQLNASVFHYDYTNKQQLGRQQDAIYGAVQTLLNIPKSKLDGAEVSIAWHPVGGLTLDGAVTYLKSKVTSDLFNTGPYPLVLSSGPPEVPLLINFRGEPFPFTPEWSLHYGARYDWSLNDRMGAFVAVDGSYQTKSSAAFGFGQATVTGAPPLVINAYGLLNLTAGLEASDKRWRFEIFGKNVTNKYYWNSVNYIADSSVRFAGMPVTYGARLSLRY